MFFMEKCTYCGFESDLQREHVVPIYWLGTQRNYDPDNNWIVPACRQCNSFAGAKLFISIPDKAKFIYTRLKQKAKKILRTPIWSQSELNEIAIKLRVKIEEDIINKKIIENRLNVLKSVSELPQDFERPGWVIKYIKELERIQKREKNTIKKKNKFKARNI